MLAARSRRQRERGSKYERRKDRMRSTMRGLRMLAHDAGHEPQEPEQGSSPDFGIRSARTCGKDEVSICFLRREGPPVDKSGKERTGTRAKQSNQRFAERRCV